MLRHFGGIIVSLTEISFKLFFSASEHSDTKPVPEPIQGSGIETNIDGKGKRRRLTLWLTTNKMAVPIILFMLSNTDFKTTALTIYRRNHDKL
ncbi:hypothetical protein M0802_012402 [Mischocyttarus mexicanus]|nr:hypothetical protein M0802_012402 [Mischocyttarus mexicanus]